MRVLWTARRSTRSILKESNPEYSLEGLMLKLKLQYFGHLMRRTDSLEKTLMLRQVEGRRRRGQQRMRRLDGITDAMDVSLSKLGEIVKGKPGVQQSTGSQRVGHNLATEQQVHSEIKKQQILQRYKSQILLTGPQKNLDFQVFLKKKKNQKNLAILGPLSN